jgi:hypothetical protein
MIGDVHGSSPTSVHGPVINFEYSIFTLEQFDPGVKSKLNVEPVIGVV